MYTQLILSTYSKRIVPKICNILYNNEPTSRRGDVSSTCIARVYITRMCRVINLQKTVFFPSSSPPSGPHLCGSSQHRSLYIIHIHYIIILLGIITIIIIIATCTRARVSSPVGAKTRKL